MTTCDCDRCAWTEFQQAEDVGRFAAIWNSAPRSRQRLVTKEDAEYWFLRGRQWGQMEATEQANADIRQLIKEYDV